MLGAALRFLIALSALTSVVWYIRFYGAPHAAALIVFGVDTAPAALSKGALLLNAAALWALWVVADHAAKRAHRLSRYRYIYALCLTWLLAFGPIDTLLPVALFQAATPWLFLAFIVSREANHEERAERFGAVCAITTVAVITPYWAATTGLPISPELLSAGFAAAALVLAGLTLSYRAGTHRAAGETRRLLVTWLLTVLPALLLNAMSLALRGELLPAASISLLFFPLLYTFSLAKRSRALTRAKLHVAALFVLIVLLWEIERAFDAVSSPAGALGALGIQVIVSAILIAAYRVALQRSYQLSVQLRPALDNHAKAALHLLRRVALRLSVLRRQLERTQHVLERSAHAAPELERELFIAHARTGTVLSTTKGFIEHFSPSNERIDAMDVALLIVQAANGLGVPLEIGTNSSSAEVRGVPGQLQAAFRSLLRHLQRRGHLVKLQLHFMLRALEVELRLIPHYAPGSLRVVGITERLRSLAYARVVVRAHGGTLITSGGLRPKLRVLLPQHRIIVK